MLSQCFRRTPTERPTAEQLLHHAWFNDEYDNDDDDGDHVHETDGFDEDSVSFSSSKKRSGNLLTKSMSASRSQAMQEQPKSLEALPESVLVRMLMFMTPASVIAMARSCAHLRFLAQRNAVWVALATNRWPKLKINLDAQLTAHSGGGGAQEEGAEADFGKKLFIGCTKYDRRFTADPMYRHVRSVKGHTKKVFAMQFLEATAKLVTCSADKKIKIWEIASSHVSHLSNSNGSSTTNTTSSSSSPSSSSSSSSATSSPALLSSASTSSKDSSSGSSKKKKASVTLRGHNASVTCFHASNTVLISASCDGIIKVWDMKSKKCTTTIRTGEAGITGLQVDEKSNYLLTAGTDGIAKVWDLQSFTIRLTLTGHKSAINAMKFHHHTLATASNDKRVKVWDLRTGTLLKSLHGHKDEVLCVDLVGDVVIAGAADGSLLEWSYLDRANPGPRAYTLPPHLSTSPILTVHFDGVNTVTAGREDGLVVFWKYHSGEYHSSIRVDSGAVTALAVSNQVLATAGAGEKIVKLWALVNP